MVKIDKGPQEVLRALASGSPQDQAEALEFQRESFRAKFGCYPEELTLVSTCICAGIECVSNYCHGEPA